MLVFADQCVDVEDIPILLRNISMIDTYVHIRPSLIALILCQLFLYGFWQTELRAWCCKKASSEVA